VRFVIKEITLGTINYPALKVRSLHLKSNQNATLGAKSQNPIPQRRETHCVKNNVTGKEFTLVWLMIISRPDKYSFASSYHFPSSPSHSDFSLQWKKKPKNGIFNFNIQDKLAGSMAGDLLSAGYIFQPDAQ